MVKKVYFPTPKVRKDALILQTPSVPAGSAVYADVLKGKKRKRGTVFGYWAGSQASRSNIMVGMPRGKLSR